MHESLSRLESLCVCFDGVCIGSSGEYAELRTPRWHARMAEAMRVCCDGEGRPRVWLHMLRGLALAGGPYPFASLDSTLIARNHGGNNTRGESRKDVVSMVERVDGVQCPPRWAAIAEQLEIA
jgi:hypothetical protein